MTEPDLLRNRLPHEWRRVDLKRLLGEQKNQADEVIRAWQEAGDIETVPGKSSVYRFSSQETAPAARASAMSSRLALDMPRLTELKLPASLPTREQVRQYAGKIRPLIAAARGFVLALPHNLRMALLLLPAALLLLLAALSISGRATQSARQATDAPPQVPTLPQSIVGWYGPNGDVYGAIETGTPYEAVARYGETWVQLDIAETGLFWVRASDLPAVDMAALTDLRPPVGGYVAHVAAPGETLNDIARQTGSDVGLIRSHNRLASDTLRPGRPLIVPVLAGQTPNQIVQPQLVKEGDTSQPRVALTIDLESGTAPVQQMLETLREHDVQVTFFILAPWVEQHPELARQIVTDGHEIASHSVSHADFRTLSDQQIAEELAAAEQIVNDVTGASTRPFFRFPYGAHDDRTVQRVVEQGYLPIHWSVDSRDAAGGEKTPDFVVQQVTAQEVPEDLYGAIILTHCCIRTTTVEALPTILERFAAEGIEVGTVTDVLGS
jgi:peptidoglycan/xylan/chitin deacetylase (PgdA/CDA1 family)